MTENYPEPKEFWTDRRVCVTGGAGFLGSHLCDRLVAEGADVLVVAHGNSLRALVKNLDGISDQAVEDLNIPLGIPVVYDFSEGKVSAERLGDL